MKKDSKKHIKNKYLAKSPAEMIHLPDLKEIEKITKDLQERANPPVSLTKKQLETIVEDGIRLIKQSKNLN